MPRVVGVSVAAAAVARMHRPDHYVRDDDQKGAGYGSDQHRRLLSTCGAARDPSRAVTLMPPCTRRAHRQTAAPVTEAGAPDLTGMRAPVAGNRPREWPLARRRVAHRPHVQVLAAIDRKPGDLPVVLHREDVDDTGDVAVAEINLELDDARIAVRVVPVVDDRPVGLLDVLEVPPADRSRPLRDSIGEIGIQSASSAKRSATAS